uniref:Swi3 domain-containing protein n=1 Tax=Panagrellus redivivus TaxID=6233 RepID=A0A7E4UML2_PANRE
MRGHLQTESTTTMASTRKRTRASSSSSEDSDADTGLNNSTNAPRKALKVFEIRDLVTQLRAECGSELPRLSARHDVSKLVEKYKSLEPFKDLVNDPDFDRQWKLLFGYATRPKNITLADSTQILNNFLENGHVVTFFEGFPKKARRAIDYYVSEKKTPNSTVADSGKLRKQFTTDPDAEIYRKKADADRDRFARELQAFNDNNQERLSEPQKEYIRQRIRNLAVKADGTTKRPRKSRKTAFDWYKDLNAAEFADLPEEKRDRKLLKKYNKLSEAELAIFEKLAGNKKSE